MIIRNKCWFKCKLIGGSVFYLFEIKKISVCAYLTERSLRYVSQMRFLLTCHLIVCFVFGLETSLFYNNKKGSLRRATSALLTHFNIGRRAKLPKIYFLATIDNFFFVLEWLKTAICVIFFFTYLYTTQEKKHSGFCTLYNNNKCKILYNNNKCVQRITYDL